MKHIFDSKVLFNLFFSKYNHVPKYMANSLSTKAYSPCIVECDEQIKGAHRNDFQYINNMLAV